jgi:hypothetical protein
VENYFIKKPLAKEDGWRERNKGRRAVSRKRRTAAPKKNFKKVLDGGGRRN